MNELSETKKKMGAALKHQLGKLVLPDEKTKKVISKQNLEVTLNSGCKAYIGCAEVKAGRAPGSYAIYWLLSLSEGPIFEAMMATGLDKSNSFSGTVFFVGTSHNLSGQSHYEVSPYIDFEDTAQAVCKAVTEIALPIVKAFGSDHNAAVDFVLGGGQRYVRNPFTICIILLNMCNRLDRIDEVVAKAGEVEGFYDYKSVSDPKTSIIDPINKWFTNKG
jgi:hypothetical protein